MSKTKYRWGHFCIGLTTFLHLSVAQLVTDDTDSDNLPLSTINELNEYYEYRSTVLNTTGLIEKYCDGFTAKPYPVITEDHYNCTIFRVVKKDGTLANLCTVLLNHGQCDSSAGYCTQGQDSTACAMARAGYDVWLGNTPGSTYCLANTKFKTTQKEFWNIDVDKIGQHTMRAMILVVLQIAERCFLTLVGYSMSGFSSVVNYCLNTDLRQNITAHMLIAPSGRLGNMYSPLGLLTSDEAQVAQYMTGGATVPVKINPFINFVASAACEDSEHVCPSALHIVGGLPDPEPAWISETLKQLPAVCPMGVNAHLLQIKKACRMQSYDHRSGVCQQFPYFCSEPKPIEYNADKCGMGLKRSILVVGNQDSLTTVQDVKNMHDQLNSSGLSKFVTLDKFGHMSPRFGNVTRLNTILLDFLASVCDKVQAVCNSKFTPRI